MVYLSIHLQSFCKDPHAPLTAPVIQRGREKYYQPLLAVISHGIGDDHGGFWKTHGFPPVPSQKHHGNKGFKYPLRGYLKCTISHGFCEIHEFRVTF